MRSTFLAKCAEVEWSKRYLIIAPDHINQAKNRKLSATRNAVCSASAAVTQAPKGKVASRIYKPISEQLFFTELSV